jgi:HD superfamily phosphodiesterase
VPQLVDQAADLTRSILAGNPERLRHSEAVAARAQLLTAAVEDDQAPLLVASAWLHDIGYAVGLHDTGFHPVDGARHLRATGWPPALCDLVAHHSGSRFVATERRLDDEIGEFTFQQD